MGGFFNSNEKNIVRPLCGSGSVINMLWEASGESPQGFDFHTDNGQDSQLSTFASREYPRGMHKKPSRRTRRSAKEARG
jgi:hypothetical protein